MKKVLQFLLHRIVIIVALMLAQIALVAVMMLRFQQSFVYFYWICAIFSGCVALYIVGTKRNPDYKIAWVILVLLVPFFGGMLFLLFSGRRRTRWQRKRLRRMTRNYSAVMQTAPLVVEELQKVSPGAAKQSRYLRDWAHCPGYFNTYTEYLPTGEAAFEKMLFELRQAKRYIFLEFFIVQEGKMWNTILDLLEEKVRQGVEVRVLYDDMGCILTLPERYWKTVESKGIRCCVFNPFIPVLTSRFNNRDHRKICVVDGQVAFTGGYNLADEYINEIEKHGHWKDTGVLLKGDAAWGFTLMFLTMWDYVNDLDEDYRRYLPEPCSRTEEEGVVQPYDDCPLDDESVGENVYMNLLGQAKRYVYITTPYLIPSNEMVVSLTSAAKSGVDVRIITPAVPDKWYVHAVTRAHYLRLVEAGVKIYEYTPGFIHAKTFVADDEYAVVGSINLDYRSLFLQYECAVWLYRARCIPQMKNDFFKTLEQCQAVTLDHCRNVPWYLRLVRSVLRVFAPLM